MTIVIYSLLLSFIDLVWFSVHFLLVNFIEFFSINSRIQQHSTQYSINFLKILISPSTDDIKTYLSTTPILLIGAENFISRVVLLVTFYYEFNSYLY